ncbi:hypothetical protein [Microbacterium sp.]
MNSDHDAFRKAADSLRLYRRADLRSDSGEELIEALYVDPLPNEHVLQTLLLPRTTFLVGRKGTGKSTIFQRAQQVLRSRADVATAYVDIKSVYESSRIEPAISLQNAGPAAIAIPEIEERLELDREFFLAIIAAIRGSLRRTLENASTWERIRARKRFRQLPEIFEKFDELVALAKVKQFRDLTTVVERGVNSTQGSESEGRDEVSGSLGLTATGAGLKVGGTSSRSSAESNTLESRQASILMSVFNLKKMIGELREILNEAGINSLYVFLDDFSELPEEAMRIVIDAMVAPLNNWSEELVKFKIAAYPGRLYVGEIDPTKSDQIDLDLFRLYGGTDVERMEEKAIDFTRRLVTRRLEYHGIRDVSVIFDAHADIWRLLFQASMANPRTLGYLLFFSYELALIYGRKIGVQTIRSAAEKYYAEKIYASFEMQRLFNVSFDERSSRYGLKDLLAQVVNRARATRKSDTSVIRDLQGRAPTSHFHVAAGFESLLDSLELGFFVTKYTVMRNKDGSEMIVYALNFGLCQQEKIEFGRPTGPRAMRYRQYYVERVFDYSHLFAQYIRSNQELSCADCGAKHDLALLEAIRAFGMLCPACKSGTCEITNLSKKYEDRLNAVDASLLLPNTELGILLTVLSEDNPLGASEVAGELDCSYQLVGKRVKNLDELGLVDREKWDGGRRMYAATSLARDVYGIAIDSEDENGKENG